MKFDKKLATIWIVTIAWAVWLGYAWIQNPPGDAYRALNFDKQQTEVKDGTRD